jgi:hypothetical protein
MVLAKPARGRNVAPAQSNGVILMKRIVTLIALVFSFGAFADHHMAGSKADEKDPAAASGSSASATSDKAAASDQDKSADKDAKAGKTKKMAKPKKEATPQ